MTKVANCKSHCQEHYKKICSPRPSESSVSINSDQECCHECRLTVNGDEDMWIGCDGSC